MVIWKSVCGEAGEPAEGKIEASDYGTGDQGAEDAGRDRELRHQPQG
jgi:hypothetical protein